MPQSTFTRIGPGNNGVRLVDDSHSEAAIHSVLAASRDDCCFLVASTRHLKQRQADSTLAPLATPSLLCMSAGSTGTAKIVRRTQLSWIRSFDVNATRFAIGENDRYAIVGKLRHSLPLYAAMEAMHIGADLHLVDHLSPSQQLHALQQDNVSIVYATPTQLRLLLIASNPAPIPLPALRLVMCGGGKLDSRTRTRFQSLAPNAAVHEFYGASETSFITIGDSTTPEGAVGRAYPGVDIRIANDGSSDSSDSGIGEISVNSPYLFSDYVSGCDDNTRWINRHLCFGEMGKLDSSGNLFVYGRRNRMVTVGDINVYPEYFETKISLHPGVAHCAVVSRSDRLRGNQLVAFVQGTHDALDPGELFQYLRHGNDQASMLKLIRIVESLPILASGKPDLEKISQWAATL